MRRFLVLAVLFWIFTSLALWADTTQFTDSFGRADASNLGASWDTVTSADAISISGNQAQVTNLSTDTAETVNAVAINNDQWAQVTIRALTGTAGVANRAGVLVRAATPAQTWYACVAQLAGAAFTTRIEYRVAGTLTASSSENSVTWAPNDVLKVGVVGTTITCYRNGSTTGMPTPLTDANLTGGRPGIFLVNQDALSSSAVDDFSAGDFTTPSSATTRALLVGVGQ